MGQGLTVQEMAIAIAVQQFNPTTLSADFLKYSGIVPTEWEMARPPYISNSGSQIIFQNGVAIVAQPNRLIFSEAIAAKSPDDMAVVGVARKFVETLTQVEYVAVGINFNGFVPFEQEPQSAHEFLTKKLLAPGPWQDFGKAPVQPSLRFVYTLEQGQLSLDINEAEVQFPDKPATSALLFSSNFNHPLSGETQSDRLKTLDHTLQNWQSDLSSYKNIITTRFLGLSGEPLPLEQGEVLAISG